MTISVDQGEEWVDWSDAIATDDAEFREFCSYTVVDRVSLVYDDLGSSIEAVITQIDLPGRQFAIRRVAGEA